MRFDDIRGWAAERNLILGSEPRAQFLKLAEEVGEIAHGMAKGRPKEIEDGIEAAWQEIKDRKGRMVDGVFIKEGD